MALIDFLPPLRRRRLSRFISGVGRRQGGGPPIKHRLLTLGVRTVVGVRPGKLTRSAGPVVRPRIIYPRLLLRAFS